MKKYTINTLVFMISFVILTHIIYKLKIYTKLVTGADVYTSIDRSLSLNKETKILLSGDSVGKQLFESLNSVDYFTSLACNQAIDMIGHYLLIDNFISKPNSVEKVYFLYNPFSLQNDLDHKFTFNYFLKPFNDYEYIERFSPYTVNQLNKIPYSHISKLPLVKLSNFSPNYSINNKNSFLSKTSIEYLSKIINLLNNKSINFTILSPPIKESRRNEIIKLIERYRVSSVKSKTMDMYFDNIWFLPDSFYSDHIHIKDKYIIDVRNSVISKFNKAYNNY